MNTGLSGTIWEFLALFPVFALANLMAAYTAHRLASAFFRIDQISLRFITLLMLMLAQIILALNLTGMAGILSFASVLALLAIFFLLTIAFTRFRRSDEAVPFHQEIGLYLRGAWALVNYNGTTLFLSFFMIFFGLVLFFLTLQNPPLFVDNVFYHLPMAVLAKQTLSLLDYIKFMPYDNFYYPINGDLVTLWTLLPFHNDFFARIYQVPFLFLIMAAFYALCRKLDVTAPRAFIFSFLTIAFPWDLVRSVTNFGVDEVFTFSMMAVALYLVLFFEKPAAARMALLAVSSGLFLGAKLLALPYFPGVIAALVYYYYRTRNSTADRLPLGPALLYLAIGSFLWGGFTYLRNWIMEGSPFYPIPLPFTSSGTGQKIAVSESARVPQIYFALRDWLHSGNIPLLSAAIFAAVVVISVILLLRSAKLGRHADIISSLALGLLIMCIGYSIYPFWIQHSRYVLPLFFIITAITAGLLEGAGKLKGKAILPAFIMACVLLLLGGLLKPNYNIYAFMNKRMLAASLLAGGVVTAAAFLLRRKFDGLLASALGKSKPAILTGAVLVIAVAALGAPLYSAYPQMKRQHFDRYYHPIYTWMDQQSLGAGKNILCLNYEASNYLILGSDLQNRVFLIPAYEDQGWDEASFREVLREHRIDWVVYFGWPIRDRHDANAVNLRYRKVPDLSLATVFVPPAVAWMDQHPEAFTLLKKFPEYRRFPEAGVYQVTAAP